MNEPEKQYYRYC